MSKLILLRFITRYAVKFARGDPLKILEVRKKIVDVTNPVFIANFFLTDSVELLFYYGFINNVIFRSLTPYLANIYSLWEL